MRLGRRRPCSRRWCRPDRERGEKKNARGFFLKYEDPGRLRVDLNPLRTVERKLESKRHPGPRNVSECLDLFSFFRLAF